MHMRAPSDPLINECAYFQQAELLEITGNVYGLASAPWSWTCEVIERLNSLGFVCHSLDSMCFMLYNNHYELLCIVIFHVDDVLIAWDETWNVKTFKDLFEWGEWLEAPSTLTYVARQIRFEPLTESNEKNVSAGAHGVGTNASRGSHAVATQETMSVVVYQEKSIRAIGNAKVNAKG